MNVQWFDALGGWAQALLATAAIWAAGRFSSREFLERRAEGMEAFHGIARQASLAITRGLNELNTPTATSSLGRPDSARLTDAEELLKSVPVYELGASRGAEMVAELLHVVRQAKALFGNRYVLVGEPFWVAKLLVLEAEAQGLVDRVAEWRTNRERRARMWLFPKQGR